MTSSERFIPVPLSRWETVLHKSFWICHSLIAFIIAYYSARGEVFEWIQHWLTPSSYLPGLHIDASDSEWYFYKQNAVRMAVCYAVHSLVFFISHRLLPNHKWSLYGSLLAQAMLHIGLTSWPCVLVCSLLSLLVISISTVTRRQVFAWIFCIGFVLQCSKFAPFSRGSHVYYLEFNLYAYTCLKIINVSLYLCRNPSRVMDSQLISQILQYMLYLPYSITLIVLFEDFQSQLERKRKFEETAESWRTREMDTKEILKGVFRLVFWSFILDVLLHFIYANAIFSSPNTLIYGMNGYQLMSISYVVGQFFHVKYVVIFGVPAFFAQIDGMAPPPPPICVSRVSRYSRMWRHFDAGLYQFLKNQVYIPLMTGTSGLSAVLFRILALVGAFTVVLVWHGFDAHYVCWVTLSAFELIVEWIGRTLWDTQEFQSVRAAVGERGVRRLIAVGMLATVIPGIFGVFCFLGSSGIGTTVLRKVLGEGFKGIFTMDMSIMEDGMPTPGLLLVHLLILGYFFNNYTLDLDIQAEKVMKNSKKKK